MDQLAGYLTVLRKGGSTRSSSGSISDLCLCCSVQCILEMVEFDKDTAPTYNKNRGFVRVVAKDELLTESDPPRKKRGEEEVGNMKRVRITAQSWPESSIRVQPSYTRVAVT